MENSLQIQQIELFLEEVIIRELGKMQEIEISYMRKDSLPVGFQIV